MGATKKRHEVALKEFHRLLRSGNDYTVSYMSKKASKLAFIEAGTIERVVNKHYQKIISDEMVEFINNSNCSKKKEIKLFSERFEICKRESILIIRYIKRRK